MDSKEIVFNSFPRSGNVFMSNIVSQTLMLDMLSSVHMPEIYQVAEISNVAIFRKPEDSISSFLYKQLESSRGEFSIDGVFGSAEKAFLRYQKYFYYAKKYAHNIHIVDFENATLDPIKEIEKIATRFSLPYFEGREKATISDIKFDDKNLWEDGHDGHMPRGKSDIRLEIEDVVSGFDFIKEANGMHYEIIKLAN